MNEAEPKFLDPLTVIDLDGNAAIILPPAVLSRLSVTVGDEIIARRKGRCVELTTAALDFAGQMEVAERIMEKDRELLRRLAQS